MSVKATLLHYLQQLDGLLQKVPPDIYDASLTPDMFSLASQAGIAANFALRTYCPLVGEAVAGIDSDSASKADVLQQLGRIRQRLEALPEVRQLDNNQLIEERAGFADLSLPAPEFVQRYALPNFFFHLSMVYAIARARGVALSKGDFDGYHQYPSGFSF